MHDLSLIPMAIVLELILTVKLCVFAVAELEKEPAMQAEVKGKDSLFYCVNESFPSLDLTEPLLTNWLFLNCV